MFVKINGKPMMFIMTIAMICATLPAHAQDMEDLMSSLENHQQDSATHSKISNFSPYTLINFAPVTGIRAGHKLAKMGVYKPMHFGCMGSLGCIGYHQFADKSRPGDYNSFEKEVVDMLQPEQCVCEPPMTHLDDEWEIDCMSDEDRCMAKRIEGAAIIISLSAVGKYGTPLYYNGKSLDGWDKASWITRLQLIHKFISSHSIQDAAMTQTLKDLRDKFNGDFDKIVGYYYSGSIPDMSDIIRRKASKFRAKQHYVNSIEKCYDKKAMKHWIETDEDIHFLMECISDKEWGYHKYGY